jgi:hypothetical protein
VKGTGFLILLLGSFMAGIGVGYRMAPKQEGSPRPNSESGQVADRAHPGANPRSGKQADGIAAKKSIADRREDPQQTEKRQETGDQPNRASPLRPGRRAENAPETEDRPKPAAQVTFATHILPIFRAKCISCHGGRKTKGGLDLRTVAALLEGGESGSGFKPGNVEESVLWSYIVTDKMPPGKKKRKKNKKLTSEEKNLIRQWILAPKK